MLIAIAALLTAVTTGTATAATSRVMPHSGVVPDYTTSEAGNPFVAGWYADPDTAYYNDEFWVFPTYSAPFDEQLFMDAFSSPDLIHWTKHANVLVKANVKWAKRAMWAPAPIARNGKYYLYFGANDLQPKDTIVGGIGVAVADRPQGPYVDVLGKPLIGAYHNGAEPIDQAVFVDDDGQAYMYYGGKGRANVVLINKDMTSIGTFSDGTQFREITPDNYEEGPLMFKRKEVYYFMWSEGGWGGPDYAVSYAMANNPLGPFRRVAKILQQDAAVATSSGHNGVINVPGTDIWYIVYHRRPLNETDQDHRVLCYDRMYFDADGTIRPVTMLAKDNFADGNLLGWTTYGGSFRVEAGRMVAASSLGGKALLETNFTDLVLDADVTVTSGSGDAGVLFRVTDPAVGTDTYKGYFAGISTKGQVVLQRADHGSWAELGVKVTEVEAGKQYHVRVVAKGPGISVYVHDMATPKISVTDGKYATGKDGVRVYASAATFANFSVAKP